ncbi:MAG: hypothetical protein QXD77_02320 [Candidatus Aenigmatarchaeota archaeon]
MDAQHLREYDGKIVKYGFIPNREPICTSECAHCYIRHSGSLKERVMKSDDTVLSEITGLVDRGYTVVPLTTEMLLMSNWKDILRSVGEKKIYTNGRLIAEDSSIVNELADEGIYEAHITGNVPGYNDRLRLMQPKKIDDAISFLFAAGVKPVVTLLMTTDNCGNLEQMLDYYCSQGISDFELIRVIGNWDYVMDKEQTAAFFKEFDKIKAKNGIRLKLDSSFGKHGDHTDGDGFFCGAGTDKVDIGYDNYVYPCSLLQYKEHRIGIFKNGRILLKEHLPFDGLEKDECMSYQLLRKK